MQCVRFVLSSSLSFHSLICFSLHDQLVEVRRARTDSCDRPPARSATNPRTLLRVAPTILKQSLMARQAGVVDLDSLRDALSYFLQELLRFTLPGVLLWLVEEVERTPYVAFPVSSQAVSHLPRRSRVTA